MITKPKGHHQRGTPTRILDLLEIDGGTMTLRQLRTEFDDRFPDTSNDALVRAVRRLTLSGHLNQQTVLQRGYQNQYGADTVRHVSAYSKGRSS